MGQSSTIPFTVTTEGFTEPLTYQITGTDASAFSVSDGGTRALESKQVTFTPTSAKSYTANLIISTTNEEAEDVSIPLTGSGLQPSLSITPTSYDFGNITINTYTTNDFTVAGSNLTNDITLSVPTGFSYATGSNWNARTGGTVTVTFSPLAVQEYTGNLTATSGSQSASSMLVGEGIGVPALTVTPKPVNFADTIIGETDTKQVTVIGEYLTEDIVIPSAAPFIGVTDTGWNNRTGGTITYTFTPTSEQDYSEIFTFTSGDAGDSITLNGTGIDYNLILESNSTITIPEATFSKVDGTTYSFYIPSDTVVNTAIVCNNIIEKASDITLMDVDLEYTGTTNFILDDVSIYNLTLNNASGDPNLTVSYRNANIQNLTSSDWRAESIINLQPYDIGEESNIDLTVTQTFTGNNFRATNLKVTYTGTSSSAFNLTNQVSGEKNTANNLEIIGAGDNVLYQYSVDNSSFREITVRNQTVSSLGLVSGVDFTTVVSISFDHVKFLGDTLQTLTDTIVNTKPVGSSLTITFENGSDVFTDEQVTALEEVNVTIITTNN